MCPRGDPMTYSGLDIYQTYFEVSEDFPELNLNNDDNVEDPVMIVGCRKWVDSGLGESGPDLWFLGLRMVEYVKVHDKYDLFIYQKD
jgi:hypothetical protein